MTRYQVDVGSGFPALAVEASHPSGVVEMIRFEKGKTLTFLPTSTFTKLLYRSTTHSDSIRSSRRNRVIEKNKNIVGEEDHVALQLAVDAIVY